MAGRRVLYGALLLGAAILHIAYGQYVTFYVLLFLLCLPVVSLLLSLPAILTARAELIGGEDVRRGRICRIRLNVESRFFLPPEAWKLCIEQKNLFTDVRSERQSLRLYGVQKETQVFTPDTSALGTIRYRIRSVRVCDYLGILAIPVKRGSAVTVTVLPDAKRPVPEPDLLESSSRVMKPKPQGFSEEHELRPYREGDAINLIHWKLSSKYDEPIVREPQELIRKNVVITVDLPRSYQACESVLEQLQYLSDMLLESKTPYLLHLGFRSQMIRSGGEFDRLLKTVLSEPRRVEAAQPVRVGNDTLLYRIVPGKEAQP